MKLTDLYQSVSQLGFEDSLGDEAAKRFIYATNRALIEINALRPRSKRVTINHRVPTNLLGTMPTQAECEGKTVYSATKGKSYYLEVCGTGEIRVGAKYMEYKDALDEDGNVILDGEGNPTKKWYDTTSKGTIRPFNTQNKNSFNVLKGFITYGEAFIDKEDEKTDGYSDECFIEIESEYGYTVRNIAIYDKIYSDLDEDIPPFTEKVPYKVSALVNDFERFDSSPKDITSQKYLHRDYEIEGNDTVLLPLTEQGAYEISYIHRVITFDTYTDVNSEEHLIDLDEDLASLMPSLVAAYVWLDDEPEKAQYYMNLYMQRAMQIQRESKDFNPVIFQSVYGW